MVYISSWQEYQNAAEALYATSPNKTRYCVKWKSSEGKLVLKITDDTTCLKFKTHSSIFLNRFETLNRTLIQKMTNAHARLPTPESRASTPQINPASSTPRSSTPAPSAPPAASTGGGTKKKKKKNK
ncbi:signal recognition particle, SRP9/SRP14 subunit [Vararia minispora EC-137]|uniref:Signal recognition particle, SRP9/SRP14 subunit n=1 Tax=Vararia minispora EC-137 TaxID=1314806 RepID=A0ACB8QW13_9AGAM|nr:signal recognition particle, SRP9/SRP14 subunit [Vararia minispora EC-137]